jgi:hypothetical protein
MAYGERDRFGARGRDARESEYGPEQERYGGEGMNDRLQRQRWGRSGVGNRSWGDSGDRYGNPGQGEYGQQFSGRPDDEWQGTHEFPGEDGPGRSSRWHQRGYEDDSLGAASGGYDPRRSQYGPPQEFGQYGNRGAGRPANESAWRYGRESGYGQTQYGGTRGRYSGNPSIGRYGTGDLYDDEYGPPSSGTGRGRMGRGGRGFGGETEDEWSGNRWGVGSPFARSFDRENRDQEWSGSGSGSSMRSQQNYSGRGPRNYRRSDERIEEEINEMLTRHPGVDASDIEVSVKDGEVTLSGTVDDRRTSRMIEDTIDDITGVHDVHNQIRVKNRQSSQSDQEQHRSTQREGGMTNGNPGTSASGSSGSGASGSSGTTGRTGSESSKKPEGSRSTAGSGSHT